MKKKQHEKKRKMMGNYKPKDKNLNDQKKSGDRLNELLNIAKK